MDDQEFLSGKESSDDQGGQEKQCLELQIEIVNGTEVEDIKFSMSFFGLTGLYPTPWLV